MKPGTQIIYIPNHELKDYEKTGAINFSSGGAEPGFITGSRRVGKIDTLFCRYWLINKYDNIGPEYELRTKANSELTPASNLVAKDTVPQKIVDKLMKDLGYTSKSHT